MAAEDAVEFYWTTTSSSYHALVRRQFGLSTRIVMVVMKHKRKRQWIVHDQVHSFRSTFIELKDAKAFAEITAKLTCS